MFSYDSLNLQDSEEEEIEQSQPSYTLGKRSVSSVGSVSHDSDDYSRSGSVLQKIDESTKLIESSVIVKGIPFFVLCKVVPFKLCRSWE